MHRPSGAVHSWVSTCRHVDTCGGTSDGKVWFSLVQYPKFANAKPNHPFPLAVFWNLERNVAFRFKKRSVHVRTQFEHKRELGSTGRSACTSVVWRQRDSLVGVLRAAPMDLPLRQGAGGRRHARGGGELARGRGEGRASHCRGAVGRARGGACSGVR